MSFFDAFGEMMVLLSAMIVGYAANRLGYLGGDTDQKISKLLLNFTLPAMIVASVVSGEELPEVEVIFSLLLVSAVFYLLSFAVALAAPLFLGGTPGQKGVWRYTLAFSNMAFIGYPVVVALFGEGALFYATILTLPFNLLSYSLGPLMLAGAARFRWKQLLNPCIVAAVVALVLALTRLRPPALVGEMLDFTGSITVPLSLLVIGSLLAEMPAKQVLRAPRLWILAAIRLLVLPVALWLIFQLMDLEDIVIKVAVIQMAMPVAVNGTLLSMEYGGDTECMAQATFLTTTSSILTIPIIATLLL